jgi:hypothetical protein
MVITKNDNINVKKALRTKMEKKIWVKTIVQNFYHN